MLFNVLFVFFCAMNFFKFIEVAVNFEKPFF